jgi:hypothetical protein
MSYRIERACAHERESKIHAEERARFGFAFVLVISCLMWAGIIWLAQWVLG